MYPIAQVCFQNRQKDFSIFKNVCFRHWHYQIERKYFVYSIESRKRVEFQTKAQAQIDVEEWESAKDITPRIYKAWKMVILLVGGTLNTMTATFHRNFEFTSTEASDEDDHWQSQMPQRGDGGLPDIVNCLLLSISFLHEPPFRVFGSSRRSFLPELRTISASFFISTFFVPNFCLDRPFGFRSTGKRIFA